MISLASWLFLIRSLSLHICLDLHPFFPFPATYLLVFAPFGVLVQISGSESGSILGGTLRPHLLSSMGLYLEGGTGTVYVQMCVFVHVCVYVCSGSALTCLLCVLEPRVPPALCKDCLSPHV